MGERGVVDDAVGRGSPPQAADERSRWRARRVDGPTTIRTPAGDAVPARSPTRASLWRRPSDARRRGAGSSRWSPGRGRSGRRLERDPPLMCASRESGRPVSVGLTQARQYPDVWRDSLARIERATGADVRIVPQVAPRSIGLMLGMDGLLSPLLLFPAAGDLLDKRPDELAILLRDAELRRRLAESVDPSGEIMAGMATLDRVFPVTEAGVASYETAPERSVAGIAARRGVLPGQVILDELVVGSPAALPDRALQLRHGGGRRDARASLSVPGLGDAGAHTSHLRRRRRRSTGLLRRRRAMTLGAIRKLTAAPASAWNCDRGLVREGPLADLNVIDLDRLDLGLPEVRHDLPGAPNLSQRADRL
jgi:N-acyl-D-aspartate/D-glutamate deacylase